jgi:hypothetical protein
MLPRGYYGYGGAVPLDPGGEDDDMSGGDPALAAQIAACEGSGGTATVNYSSGTVNCFRPGTQPGETGKFTVASTTGQKGTYVRGPGEPGGSASGQASSGGGASQALASVGDWWGKQSTVVKVGIVAAVGAGLYFALKPAGEK